MATTPSSKKKRDSDVAAAPGQNGKAPATPPRIEPERLLAHYRQMVLIRIFEEACLRGFRTGKIGGYLHVYIGQEAVAAGFLDAFDHEKGDKVITAYRDHAHTMLLGSTPNEVMAELYGKGAIRARIQSFSSTSVTARSTMVRSMRPPIWLDSGAATD
jgi:TPP-dependent pyruvate/acetoin dehydrogenase alpha subunit